MQGLWNSLLRSRHEYADGVDGNKLAATPQKVICIQPKSPPSSPYTVMNNPDLVKYILQFVPSGAHSHPYELLVLRRVSKTFRHIINTYSLPDYAYHYLGISNNGSQFLHMMEDYLKSRPLSLKNFKYHISWETGGIPRPEWKMEIQNKLVGSEHDHFNVAIGNGVKAIETFMRESNHQKIWAFFNIEFTRFTKVRFRRIPLEVYRMNGSKTLTRLQSERYQLPDEFLMKCVMTTDNTILQFYVQKGFIFTSENVLREYEYVHFFRSLFKKTQEICTLGSRKKVVIISERDL